MHTGTVLSRLAAALALTAALPALAVDTTQGYAEALYADYAAGTTTATFAVDTLRAGKLGEIAGLSMEQLVGAPAYLIEAEDGALAVSDVRIAPLDMNKVNNEALAARVDGFDAVGLPVDKGSYRVLQITAEVDKQLARYHLPYELRAESKEELEYEVRMPLNRKTDRLSDLIMKLDPENVTAVEWEEKKEKK